VAVVAVEPTLLQTGMVKMVVRAVVLVITVAQELFQREQETHHQLLPHKVITVELLTLMTEDQEAEAVPPLLVAMVHLPHQVQAEQVQQIHIQVLLLLMQAEAEQVQPFMQVLVQVEQVAEVLVVLVQEHLELQELQTQVVVVVVVTHKQHQTLVVQVVQELSLLVTQALYKKQLVEL
jgi:hypothetical protein